MITDDHIISNIGKSQYFSFSYSILMSSCNIGNAFACNIYLILAYIGQHWVNISPIYANVFNV